MEADLKYQEWLKTIKDNINYKDDVVLSILREIYDIGFADGCEDTENELGVE